MTSFKYYILPLLLMLISHKQDHDQVFALMYAEFVLSLASPPDLYIIDAISFPLKLYGDKLYDGLVSQYEFSIFICFCLKKCDSIDNDH